MKYFLFSVTIFILLFIVLGSHFLGKKSNALSLIENIDRYELITHNGKKFNDKIIGNHPSLVFFGFLKLERQIFQFTPPEI